MGTVVDDPERHRIVVWARLEVAMTRCADDAANSGGPQRWRLRQGLATTMPRRHCRDATVCTACALLWCALVLRFKDRTMLTGEGALPFCGADGDPRWTPLACVDGVLTSSPTEPGAISQCDLASGSKPCVPAKMWVQASCRLPPALALPEALDTAAWKMDRPSVDDRLDGLDELKACGQGESYEEELEGLRLRRGE